MADGDIAASYGFTVVQAGADLRLGYNDINRAADFAAKIAGELTPATPGTAAATVTFTSGKVRKVGKRVVVQLYLSTSSTVAALSNTVIFTLPAGYRPESLSHISGGVHVSGASTWLPCDFLLQTDGTISFQGTSASGTLDRVSLTAVFDAVS